MATRATIGEFEVVTIHDHMSAWRNPAVVFPDVPPSAWDPYRSIALNENGEWRSVWRGHLIRPVSGSGPQILVDAGMGPGPHEHTGKPGELLDSLAAEGVAPEQIDAVVTTHCHGDHIGWNVMWDGDRPRATFSNATYHIARNDWEHYTKPENANEAFDRSVRPLESVAKLELVSGEYEVAPGIRIIPANGHTPGHQCVLVESDGETGVITGDLFHSVAQVTEQTWCPTFDWDTEMSTASRKSLLGRAHREGWVVFSGHLFVDKSIGRIVERDEQYAWSPI